MVTTRKPYLDRKDRLSEEKNPKTTRQKYRAKTDKSDDIPKTGNSRAAWHNSALLQ